MHALNVSSAFGDKDEHKNRPQGFWYHSANTFLEFNLQISDEALICEAQIGPTSAKLPAKKKNKNSL